MAVNKDNSKQTWQMQETLILLIMFGSVLLTIVFIGCCSKCNSSIPESPQSEEQIVVKSDSNINQNDSLR